MSYISGNTFFIENAINCSVSGTINGQPIFIDCSKNCGQVLNAIFSGSGVCNDGQAYGCTIFCNAANYGYVYGTGILRGNSILYGGADCVIQCDQSVIDAGATVTSCEFLVNTLLPVNNYSNDSLYYIYSCGNATLATGAWSNAYFDSGSPILNWCDNAYPIAAQAQNDGLWYAHDLDSGYAPLNNFNLATGFYVNGVFANGVLDVINSLNIKCAKKIVNIDQNLCPNRYELYVSGFPCGNLNGFYYIDAEGVNNTNALFLQNNCQSDPSAFGCFIFKVQNSELLGDCSELYGYYSSDNGQVFTLDGFYPSGYFPSCCIYGIICYCNPYLNLVSCANLTKKDTAFSSLTPVAAQLTCSYYIYDSGNVTIANGSYSNYAIVNGDIDANYSTNTPTGAIDCGCQIYENGTAICVDNVNYILDDDLYYGSDWPSIKTQDSYFTSLNSCYAIRKYRSNDNYALIAENCGSSGVYGRQNLFTPTVLYTETAEVNPFQYCGFFTFGNCSFKSNSIIEFMFSIATDYNQLTPYATIPDRYFTYSSGIGVIPNGAYSNYYFSNSTGINYEYSCLIPACAQDNGCYYVYCEGAAAIATGAYSNYYFEPAGIVASTCTIVTPITAQDNCFYYLYTCGVPNIPCGPYSNYHFSPQSYDRYVQAIDITLPTEALDCLGYYYTYTQGTGFGATGAYSNFYFAPEFCINSTYCCVGVGAPQTAQDDSKYYEYFEGCALIVTGCRNDVIGWDASASGIYNFGDTGEYNPVPCFVAGGISGPYTYTYYCNGIADSCTGIAKFINEGAGLTVCCGDGLGDVGIRCFWFYDSTVSCSGIDPSTVNFNNNGSINTKCLCCYSCSDAQATCYSTCCGCYYVAGTTAQDIPFVSINGVFYTNILTDSVINECCTISYSYCYYCAWNDLYDENATCCGREVTAEYYCDAGFYVVFTNGSFESSRCIVNCSTDSNHSCDCYYDICCTANILNANPNCFSFITL